MKKIDIENKIEINNKKIRELREENEELEMKLLIIKTGLKIGNVIEEGGRCGIIKERGNYGCWVILKIKKDGTVGKSTYAGWNFQKLYDSYEEYQEALKKL